MQDSQRAVGETAVSAGAIHFRAERNVESSQIDKQIWCRLNRRIKNRKTKTMRHSTMESQMEGELCRWEASVFLLFGISIDP